MTTTSTHWTEIPISVPIAPAKPIQKLDFKRADILFAVVMLACGFLLWNLILWTGSLGAGVTVFSLILFACSFIYLTRSGFKQNLKSGVVLALASLSAVQFILFDNLFIGFLNFIFLALLFICWICLSTNRQIDKVLSKYLVADMVQQVICVPIRNLTALVSAVSRIPKKSSTKSIVSAISGVVIALPFLVVVTLLLMSADAAFQSFIKDTFEIADIDTIMMYAWQFVFGIPAALYMFGLIFGNVAKRYTETITAQTADKLTGALRVVPPLTVYSALTAFNLIYLAFFVVQAVYLFSAFTGTLPEAFTYAEYARRGFFELCTVASINLLVLTASHILIRREFAKESKLLRIKTALTSLFTILLIGTALSKMVMYIDTYGLTQLRVYTSWFMVLLLLIFLTVFIRQLISFNITKPIVVGFVILFMALTYGNVDGVIASHNINGHTNGILPALDIAATASLSDAAVPHLYNLYLDEKDAEMREHLEVVIMRNDSRGVGTFREFNIQRSVANDIRNTVEAESATR